MKMTVIGGSGLLGSTTAFHAGCKGLFEEIFLIGTRQNVVMSHVMDMDQALCAVSGTRIRVGTYEEIAQSDVILVTAGLPEREVENRNEYLAGNLALVQEIGAKIKAHCADPKIVLCATNPIDVFNYALYRQLGWPRKKFLGFGYNDTLRLRWALAEETGNPYDSLEAYVLGEHGDNQVPLFEHLRCWGETLTLGAAARLRVREKISGYFRRFQALDSRRTSGWTSAVSLTKILEAIGNETEEIIPCSVVPDGEYGQRDVSLGMPVRLNRSGIAEIIEFPLEEATQQNLDAAGDGIKRHIASVGL